METITAVDVRRAALSLIYAGRDISADIAPFVLSASFTDHASGKADEFTVTLEDRDGLWRGGWLPDKGATVRPAILCEHWRGPAAPGDGALTLPCGVFTIDEIEFSTTPDGGDTVTLKAVSVPVGSKLRKEKATRGWENASLAALARDIAEENGLSLLFEAADFAFARVDRRDESALGFLKRLADEAGVNLKVAEEKLVFFDGLKFDSRPASLTVTRGEDALASARLRTQTHDTYRACRVTYHDPAAKQELTAEFAAPGGAASGQVLQVTRRVESRAEAMRLARKLLRQKNRREVTGELSLMGEPRLLGGITLHLSGWRRLDGKYFVEKAVHAISRDGGYTTTADIRKTLDY